MHVPQMILTLIAASVIAASLAACEKSNEQVLQDQIRDGGSLCQKGCETPPKGCTIKGNIGPGGHFYLLRSDPRYNAAIIEPPKGERWFCTEKEALANGFLTPPQ